MLYPPWELEAYCCCSAWPRDLTLGSTGIDLGNRFIDGSNPTGSHLLKRLVPLGTRAGIDRGFRAGLMGRFHGFIDCLRCYYSGFKV